MENACFKFLDQYPLGVLMNCRTILKLMDKYGVSHKEFLDYVQKKMDAAGYPKQGKR